MKSILCIGLAFGLTAAGTSTRAQSTILSDDFNTLNSSVWQILAPLSDSQMTASGGTAVFFQRGVLVTKQDLPVGIEIRGRFAFTGGTYDQFAIGLRSDGAIIAPYFPFHTPVGVQFSRRGGDDGDQTGQRNVYLTTGVGRPAVIANFTFQIGTYYDFRIVDDGYLISVFLNNSTTAIVSGASVEREGYKVAFENRGFVPFFPLFDNQVRLDSLSILAAPAPPTITSQSNTGTVAEGENVSFSVGAASASTVTYQWYKDGIALGNGTGATLDLRTVKVADSGTYSVRASNSSGSVIGVTSTLTVRAVPAVPVVTEPGRLINISTLAPGGFVSGFVVGGASPRNVLVRVVGPTLKSAFGIADAATETGVTLYAGSAIIAANSSWGAAVNAVQIGTFAGAFPLAAGSADSAILTTLSPGNYSAKATGNGQVLLEVYEGR